MTMVNVQHNKFIKSMADLKLKIKKQLFKRKVEGQKKGGDIEGCPHTSRET